MVQRVTYRRRHSYNTISNRIKLVKTPGGKLNVHYRAKTAKGPICGDPSCAIPLSGIPHLRPIQYSRLVKAKKTVSRAYGGTLCAPCVKERILRAFLIEEQKEAKNTARIKAAEDAKNAPAPQPAAAKAPAKPKAPAAQKGGKQDTTGQRGQRGQGQKGARETDKASQKQGQKKTDKPAGKPAAAGGKPAATKAPAAKAPAAKAPATKAPGSEERRVWK